MTNEQFQALDDKLLEHADTVLGNRKEMYAQQGDRLANFKETATATGLTPEKVCEVYLYKALSAMLKILHGKSAVGETKLDRFSDVLNYVRLAYALTEESSTKPRYQEYKPLTLKYTKPSDTKAAEDLFGATCVKNRFAD